MSTKFHKQVPKGVRIGHSYLKLMAKNQEQSNRDQDQAHQQNSVQHSNDKRITQPETVPDSRCPSKKNVSKPEALPKAADQEDDYENSFATAVQLELPTSLSSVTSIHDANDSSQEEKQPDSMENSVKELIQNKSSLRQIKSEPRQVKLSGLASHEDGIDTALFFIFICALCTFATCFILTLFLIGTILILLGGTVVMLIMLIFWLSLSSFAKDRAALTVLLLLVVSYVLLFSGNTIAAGSDMH